MVVRVIEHVEFHVNDAEPTVDYFVSAMSFKQVALRGALDRERMVAE